MADLLLWLLRGKEGRALRAKGWVHIALPLMERAKLFLCIRTSRIRWLSKVSPSPWWNSALEIQTPCLCGLLSLRKCVSLSPNQASWDLELSCELRSWRFLQGVPKDPPAMVFLPSHPSSFFSFFAPNWFWWSNLRKVIFPHQLQALSKWLAAWMPAHSPFSQVHFFPERQ